MNSCSDSNSLESDNHNRKYPSDTNSNGSYESCCNSSSNSSSNSYSDSSYSDYDSSCSYNDSSCSDDDDEEYSTDDSSCYSDDSSCYSDDSSCYSYDSSSYSNDSSGSENDNSTEVDSSEDNNDASSSESSNDEGRQSRSRRKKNVVNSHSSMERALKKKTEKDRISLENYDDKSMDENSFYSRMNEDSDFPSASQVGPYSREGVLIPELSDYIPRLQPPPSHASYRIRKPNLIDRLAVVPKQDNKLKKIYNCIPISPPPSFSVSQ